MGAAPQLQFTLVFEIRSFISLELGKQITWLISEPQRAACLFFTSPISEVMSVLSCAFSFHFNMGSGAHTWVFLIARQALH